jgi:hypothetical protein
MAESDSSKEKDSSEDLEQNAHVGDHSEHPGAESRQRKTTRDGTEFVPQPSDDPRDPLVGDMEALVYCARANIVL